MKYFTFCTIRFYVVGFCFVLFCFFSIFFVGYVLFVVVFVLFGGFRVCVFCCCFSVSFLVHINNNVLSVLLNKF